MVNLVVVSSTDHGLKEGGQKNAKLFLTSTAADGKVLPRTLSDLKQGSSGMPLSQG